MRFAPQAFFMLARAAQPIRMIYWGRRYTPPPRAARSPPVTHSGHSPCASVLSGLIPTGWKSALGKHGVHTPCDNAPEGLSREMEKMGGRVLGAPTWWSTHQQLTRPIGIIRHRFYP